MTRCDYDAVFYRVFFVILLAIAFTFTVILTNVFLDIDGLLARKTDKQNARDNDNIIRDEYTSEATENDDLNYGENEESYRTKRSVETQSFLFHYKNPKVKNILANRLSTLLEELDAEELADARIKAQKVHKEEDSKINIPKTVEAVETAKIDKDEKKKKIDELLHVTMHNILLQGIIGHMDLNDVYKRFYSLMSNFNEQLSRKGRLKPKPDDVSKVGEETKITSKPIEEKFLDEMLNCNELHEQIDQNAKDKEKIKETIATKPAPKVVIKTVIDISSIGNDKLKENDTKISKENINGIIELVFNGKTIKFSRPDGEMLQPKQQNKKVPTILKPKITQPNTETTTPKVTHRGTIPKSYMDKFIEEYFKRFPRDTAETNEVKENIENKRLKRQVKIKYDNDNSIDYHNKGTKKKGKEDDELYVEIETHFDSKGMKGEKKRELIRSLIEKIQKAIHSDMQGKVMSTDKVNSTKRKKIYFRKRLQDPLKKNNHILVGKYRVPLKRVVHRELNPISKTVPMQGSSPYIGTKTGEVWKKPCYGPRFLATAKSINSAEMGEVDVDYSKVLDVNGIPQRLQLPLNSELSEETANTNSFYDMGKMKFLIKNIDGSGFSVGFNQYVDEPPDTETMRLFTGLENVIKTYHQNYDQAADAVTTTETNLNVEERVFDALPNNEHIIERRSVKKKHDYHSNEYKIIFDNDFMPFDNYQDIFEKKLRNDIEFNTKKHYKIPLIVDENIFEKNLKPAEIFGLANLFDRKKRSINVKKISNLKNKIKLNRYLNTKAMATKRIFLNKKRNKRQINKIRIIATDLPHMSKHSDENLFVVSDENVFADRAIVKEVETSDGDHDKPEDSEYQPYPEDIPSSYVTKVFDGRSRHNPLMAKYPHIFMEEISRSREEYVPNNALLFGKIPGLSKINKNTEEKFEDTTEHHVIINNTDTRRVKGEEIVNALIAPPPPPPSKANYKVTVKIIPKNQTGLNSGFKEIHTSINKSFNKNGLLYSSLVNVSEISKVVKINASKDGSDLEFKGQDSHMSKTIREQQEKMQFLLKQHAKHLNEQLNRLNEEKLNLESMLDGENITGFLYKDYNDISVQTRHGKTAVNREESSAVKGDVSKEVHATTVSIHPTEATTTTILTTTPPLQQTIPPPSIPEKIKKNIINTIERNSNLTDQILKKIDKNTELLQTFLKKLTEKIQVPIQNPVEPREVREEHTYPAWSHHGVNLNQNMIIRKNDSHISIPFVYAYQQPIIAHKANTPVASVVYHGHITNTLRPIVTSTEKEKVKPAPPNTSESTNQSRFFIDELENGYKVIQVGDLKKHSDYNMVSSNDTLT